MLTQAGADLVRKKGVGPEGIKSEKHLIFAHFVLSKEECYYSKVTPLVTIHGNSNFNGSSL